MKIMIMTDMEGVAGILDHDNWVLPEGRFYDKGMRLLTEEVNAAIDGFFGGGAKEVIVVDGHGAGGICPELLDERVMLGHGQNEKMWPWGLDKSFAGLAFVGQHAKAGTPYSHITHTQGFEYIDFMINNISIGEYGQLALCAMELEVPTIFAGGEKALAEEAEKLTPGVITVAVKRGILPDGLEHLDAEAYNKSKLSAIHLSPRQSRAHIRAGALKAIKKLKKDPALFHYPELKPPYICAVTFRRTANTPAHRRRYEHPDSLIALMNMPYEKQKKG